MFLNEEKNLMMEPLAVVAEGRAVATASSERYNNILVSFVLAKCEGKFFLCYYLRDAIEILLVTVNFGAVQTRHLLWCQSL